MYCSKLWLTLLVYIFLHEFSYCYLKSTTCLLFSLSFPCLSIFSKNLSLFLKNYPRKIMAESSLRWNKRRAMIILFLIICRHKTVMEMYCEKRTSSCFYGYQTILYFFLKKTYIMYTWACYKLYLEVQAIILVMKKYWCIKLC